MRGTVLVPAAVLRDTLDRGAPLVVEIPAPKRHLKLTLYAEWPLRFAVPLLQSVQFHYSPDDLCDEGSVAALPPWPILAPFAAEASLEKTVRVCWLSVQVTTEALALEACGQTAQYAFLAHYFGTPAQRAKAALVDAVWLVCCAAMESSALDPPTGFTPTFTAFINVGDRARVVDGAAPLRTAERWAQAGRWMAKQSRASTLLSAIASGSSLPPDWADDPMLQLAAGLCPSGTAVAPAVAIRSLYPCALYQARQQLFARAVDRLQRAPLRTWPAELVRFRRTAQSELPPMIPSRADECAKLALRCSEYTGAPLADAAALHALVARDARQRARRASALWSAPLCDQRTARYAGLRARLPTASISSLLSLAGLPPCLLHALQTARATHRLPYQDRLTLSSWLVALEPATATLAEESSLEAAVDMARFVLNEERDGARVRKLAEVITSARRQRRELHLNGESERTLVTGCKKIIARSGGADTIQCHYQQTHPTSAYDCQRQCSQGKKGLCNTPLDHLLSILDW